MDMNATRTDAATEAAYDRYASGYVGTTAAPKKRTPLPPATGTVRLLGYAADGNRQIRITVQTKAGPVCGDYEVEVLESGYNLYYWDDDGMPAYYTISIEATPDGKAVWSCTCPDATNRPERRYCCKHTRAVRALLAAEPF